METERIVREAAVAARHFLARHAFAERMAHRLPLAALVPAPVTGSRDGRG